VGFRLAKLVAGVLLALGGAYFVFQSWFTGQPADWVMEVAGVPLALAGLYFVLAVVRNRKLEAFDFFRWAVAAVLGCLVAQLVAGGANDLYRKLLAGEQDAAGVVMPAVRILGGFLIVAVLYFALWAQSGIRRILENIFSIPELLGKLVFTLALLCIYRIGFHVPLPGLNQDALNQLAASQQAGGLFGEAMQYFSMFTGGQLGGSTLFGLGIMPYISASIIFMLLANVVPALEKLQKEGPAGQKKIQEYTRYATVALCIVQATFYMRWMMTARIAGGEPLLYPEYSGSTLIFLCGVLGLTGGTIFLMWLGEQIDEYGIGNGISLLIMAGIVVRLPAAIRELVQRADFSLSGSQSAIGMPEVLFLCVSFVFVVAGAILITQGQRRIPIQQAKQTRGRRTYGGQRHYMPLRVNHGGVMPIIFASSLMIFPGVITGWLMRSWGGPGFWGDVVRNFNEAFQSDSFTYSLLYIALIFFFAYFWTTVNFRPKDMADQLRDMGHFIPGLRPGKRTAEYLERVMERITYCGAAFLSLIAVLPTVIATKLEIPFQISAFLGGTGLLIMVSVTLDLVQRIEANLVMRNYSGFLGGSSRIKGARG
jgi:preprotein translocase subunit SecY